MATKPFKAVTLVATFISPGVAKGAAGFMLVGGQVVKIPPRGPAFLKVHRSSERTEGEGRQEEPEKEVVVPTK